MKKNMTNKSFLISNIIVLVLLIFINFILIYLNYFPWLLISLDLAFLNLFLSTILFSIRFYITGSYLDKEYKDFIFIDSVLLLFWFLVISLYIIFYI
jgi:hypothetical protein